MTGRANRVYMADVSYGAASIRRGHWSDRIAGIDADLAAMQQKQKLESPPLPSSSAESADRAFRAATGNTARPAADCHHTPPKGFGPGQALPVALRIGESAQKAKLPNEKLSVRLYYRHVNQGERWGSVETILQDGSCAAVIPGSYTESKFPLQYYFALQNLRGDAWLYPGFNSTLSNQPYFSIDRRVT